MLAVPACMRICLCILALAFCAHAHAQTDPAVATRMREIAAAQKAALAKITSYKVEFERDDRREIRVPNGTDPKEVAQIAHMLGEFRTVSKGTQWWKNGQIRKQMRETQDHPVDAPWTDELANLLVEVINKKEYMARYSLEPPMANTVIVNMQRNGPQARNPEMQSALPSEPAYLELLLTTLDYDGFTWTIEDDTLDGVPLLKLTNTHRDKTGEVDSVGTIWLDPARDYFTIRTRNKSTDGVDEDRKDYTYQPLPGGGWFPKTVERFHKEKSIESESSVTYANPEVNIPLEDSFFTYETFSYRSQKDLTKVVTYTDRQEIWAWTNGQWTLQKSDPMAPPVSGTGMPGVPNPQVKKSPIKPGSREKSKHYE